MKKTVEFKQKNAPFCPDFGAKQYPQWVIDITHVYELQKDHFARNQKMNKKPKYSFHIQNDVQRAAFPSLTSPQAPRSVIPMPRRTPLCLGPR